MKSNAFDLNPVFIKMKNGLNVHLIKSESLQTYVQYDIPVGSFNTKYKIGKNIYEIKPGTHHLLEHMIFMMEDKDAFEYFHKMGVVANAMTTYRQTSYSLIGHKDMIDATLYLIKMLESPYFDPHKVEMEKQIIYEEIQMYDDEIETQLFQKMYHQLIHTHPLKNEITGTKKELSDIDSDDLFTLFNHFYCSNNRQIIIYGPIDIKAYIDVLENYESKITKTINPIIISNKEIKTVKIKEGRYNLDVTTPIFAFGLKIILDTQDEKIIYKYEIIMLFIGRLLFGNQSNFHQYLLDNHQIIDGFNFHITIEDDLLVFMMDSETYDTDELKNSILVHLKNKDIADFNEETFKLLKKAYLGHFIMALDDIENRIYIYGKYNLLGLSLKEALEIIKEIHFGDLLALYDSLNESMMSFVHVLPK
ncbi:M16 family metallopeptidase [Acholeplasma granularum]|uniref:M16 family metallopeptidase n=1 Tax=Acholeplasma granularum TaxID=264635 RepID=UPI000470039B|nr:pitrilysin family protein [Acholeplasma granularum]